MIQETVSDTTVISGHQTGNTHLFTPKGYFQI